MKIEEAILYCLTTSNRGMRTEQIADMINRQHLYLRKDGQPDVQKMGLITYEPVKYSYVLLGEKVAKAFFDGKELK